MEVTVKVALPGWMLARRAPWSGLLDVTPLIEEWTLALLDPIDELRRYAGEALKYPGWDLCGKATLSPAMMRLVREAASDVDVLAAVARSSYAPLVRGRLQPQATCLLLGLVVVTALHADIGKGAAALRAEIKGRQQHPARTSERQRSEDDAPRAAAAAERPTLSPLPADLRAPSSEAEPR